MRSSGKKATTVEKCGMLPSGGSVQLCNYSNHAQLYFTNANCALAVSRIRLCWNYFPIASSLALYTSCTQ